MIPNKLYDTLKFLAQIALPAFGTLYYALASTWSLGYADQVVGTVIAVDTFLGVLLGISTAKYNAGTEKDAGELQAYDDQAVMVFHKHPDELAEKNKRVTFKVVQKQGPADQSIPEALPPVAPPAPPV